MSISRRESLPKFLTTGPWVLIAFVTLVTFSNIGTASATGSNQHDPCGFLTTAEVETVMGPLAGAPYRVSRGVAPQANGSDCRYEAPDRHSIRLSVTWEGGRDLIAMMGSMQAMVDAAGLSQLKLADGTTIAGHWDQARVNQCCEFNALRGDRVVTVDVSGSHATIAQAAGLADAAVQRLDQPLPISGATGLKPAQDRAALRPKPRNVCDLLTKADAEAIVGVSLLQPPTGTIEHCRYVWPTNPQGSSYQLDLAVTWQDGFSEMRFTDSAVGNASAMIGFGKPQGQTATDRESGPWDEFSQSIIGVSAVKGDIRISVEGGPMQQDLQRAFVQKAIVNLGK
jgi:hypothetical protein